MFEVTASQSFKASHAIRTLSGDLEPTHEHDWRIVVTVLGSSLDSNGCVIDFAVIQRHVRSCLENWEGKDLNTLGIFMDMPPSTEFLAKCLFDQLDPLMSEDGYTLKRVTIWETDNCSAAFVRD